MKVPFDRVVMTIVLLSCSDDAISGMFVCHFGGGFGNGSGVDGFTGIMISL